MTFLIVAVTILATVLAFVVYKYATSVNKADNSQIESLQSEVNRLTLEKAVAEERLEQQKIAADELLKSKLADAERLRLSEREAAEKRIAEERASLGERFKALATEILQANSKQLDSQSRISLEAILSPVKASLETFTRDFKDCYNVEARDRLSLREGIQSLMELNRRVSDEANRLTHALKGDTGIQGKWGEMVLQNILEHSGLEQSRWFITQDSSTDDEGKRLRPDAVINCPQERKIIIDSKVSLSAYLDWMNADSDKQRDECVKAHLRSIDNHIRCLRDKSYQDRVGVQKADFVLMFMPHEGAYIMAMQANPNLWQQAYESRVIIVSPTHLITVVKLVEQMWYAENRDVNAIKIADEARKMLEKLMGMLDDISKVGDSLTKSQTAYENAIKKLKDGPGNVIKHIETLNRLGIRAKKAIPTRFADAQGCDDDNTSLLTEQSEINED